jgi:acyl-CoA dehydrogenase
MPFSSLLVTAEVMALVDGPTEVHQMTLAKELLAAAPSHEGHWGSAHLPTLRAAAEEHVARRLDLVVAAQ